MGNTIDGTSSTTTSYKIEEPKTEGPPKASEEKPRTFLEKATAWAEAATNCTGALTPAPVGTLATFFAEKAKGASTADAASWAVAKTYGEAAAHVVGDILGHEPGGAAAQALSCVESIHTAATGESVLEAAVQGKLAEGVLNTAAVDQAVAAAVTSSKQP
jgi:hypothetical protein